jgi:serine/threonine protein kinase
MTPPPHDVPELEGKVIGGKYRVDRIIGTGGMGTVWEGIHEALGHKVAIKFIKPAYASHPDARKRFEIEARAAAKLKTKHAVQVYDFGVTEEGLPYIVMEYLEGQSLSEFLMACGPLPGREVGLIIGAGFARARQGARGGDRAPRSQARQHLPRDERRGSR